MEEEFFVPLGKKVWKKNPALNEIIPEGRWEDERSITAPGGKSFTVASSYGITDRAGYERIMAAWKALYEEEGVREAYPLLERIVKSAKLTRLSVAELIAKGHTATLTLIMPSGRSRHVFRTHEDVRDFPWEKADWVLQLLRRVPSAIENPRITGRAEKTESMKEKELVITADEVREEDRYMFRLPGTSFFVSGSPAVMQSYREMYPGYDFQETFIKGRSRTAKTSVRMPSPAHEGGKGR